MEPGGGPPKRARRGEEGETVPPDSSCGGRTRGRTLSKSQRMLWDAASLRQRAAEVQAAAEAAAEAAVTRREAAERLLQKARIQAAAAEQRALEDAQPVLQRAQASIEAAGAAAAMEPEGSPARIEAAAAAVAALASVRKQVKAHVAAVKARAEVAYGVTKASAIIAAAAAEAEAALAGWPAERCRLLMEATRLELQAAAVAELEAQHGSALVQALATSGCLPLIASCLGDATDKVHFALTCKALLRQYCQDQAAWLRGLHVSLAVAREEDVESCGQQLQRLLQRLPPGSIASLSLAVTSPRRFCAQERLDVLLMHPCHQGLTQVELSIRTDNLWFGPVELNLPLLRRAKLVSNGSSEGYCCDWSFAHTPLLESLQFSNGTIRHLPLALTRLELGNVKMREEAVSSLMRATAMRSLHLRDLAVGGAPDFAQLSSLTRLTALTLVGPADHFMTALHNSVPALLQPMRSLADLCLAAARMDALAALSSSLTRLRMSTLRYAYHNDTFELSHITRHTALHTLVWAGGPWDVHTQIQSLTHIPNLTCI